MIEVHELTKRFPAPRGREIVAVDRVSFAVMPGEVYGLLGPNGAGKTTTLRMILGLLAPTSGHAAIEGYRSDTAADEVKRRVGLVSATAGVYPWLSVRETLHYFADLYGVPPVVATRRVAELSDLLDMDPFLDRRSVTLSTGQRQRVNLARALVHDPPVMLLDEPTLGLDVIASQVVLEYVRRLRGFGKATIFTTHNLDEAERYCDRFGLLHLGSIQSEGTLDQLRAATGQATLVDMFLALAGRGAAVTAVDAAP